MDKLYVICALFLTLLTGCTNVVSKTTSFYEPDYFTSGNIYVTTKNEKLKDSIGFKNYKRIIENNFTLMGYLVVDQKENADYVAYVDYKIDNGKYNMDGDAVFKRELSLDIYEEEKKVYEANTESFGECDSLYTVLPGMIEAMFTDYPGLFADTRKEAVIVSKYCG